MMYVIFRNISFLFFSFCEWFWCLFCILGHAAPLRRLERGNCAFGVRHSDRSSDEDMSSDLREMRERLYGNYGKQLSEEGCENFYLCSSFSFCIFSLISLFVNVWYWECLWGEGCDT